MELVHIQETFLKNFQQILQSSTECGTVGLEDAQELSRILAVLDIGLGKIVVDLLGGQHRLSEQQSQELQ